MLEMDDNTYLKFRFGPLFEDVRNLNAIFSLMERELKVNNFVEMNFEDKDDNSLTRLAITDNDEYLTLRMQFKDPDDEIIEKEALKANKVFEEFKGTDDEKPVKSLIILIDDPVTERIKQCNLSNGCIRNVEICSFKDIDGDKHLARIKKKLDVN